uniref:Uncharacterized protein n=1 Tax=Anguilla anguilla TaxID=7936 RepID=A0A0E9VAY9_ANGAN
MSLPLIDLHIHGQCNSIIRGYVRSAGFTVTEDYTASMQC